MSSVAKRSSVRVVAASLSAAIASCTLVVDTSELADGALPISPDAGPARDAAPDEGRPAADADAAPGVEPDADAGPTTNACGARLFGTREPLLNGDFELGCATGWSGYQAIISERTTPTANGTIACRVCYTAGDHGFFISGRLTKNVAPGEIYELVACVRADPDSDAGVQPYAEMNAGPNGAGGLSVPAGETYAPIRLALEIGSSSETIDLRVRAGGVPNGCFYVDDITLSRVR